MPLGGSDDAAGADTDARQPDRVAGDGHRQSIEVRLFGTFQVSCDGQLVESWQGQKCARLVRYLFAQAPRQIGREALAELFWPDADTEVARRGLHQAIYKIRRSLRHAGCTGSGILYVNETYGIDPSLDHVSDIGEFERLADAARDAERQGVERAAFDALQAAVAWYRGDLLEDSPHEEWTLYERDRLRLRYVEIANRLAEILLGQGEHEGALAVSQRLLTHELADESAHRRVIRCFVHQGQRSLAIRQYQICTEALDRTFGVVPAPETTRLYEDLIASEDR